MSEFSQFLPEASAYTSSFPLGGPPPTKKQAVSAGVGKSVKGSRKVCGLRERGHTQFVMQSRLLTVQLIVVIIVFDVIVVIVTIVVISSGLTEWYVHQ